MARWRWGRNGRADSLIPTNTTSPFCTPRPDQRANLISTSAYLLRIMGEGVYIGKVFNISNKYKSWMTVIPRELGDEESLFSRLFEKS